MLHPVQSSLSSPKQVVGTINPTVSAGTVSRPMVTFMSIVRPQGPMMFVHHGFYNTLLEHQMYHLINLIC